VQICVGDRVPVTSSDGKRVAFMYSPPRRPHGSSHFDLMVMSSDGRGRQLLAPGLPYVRQVIWSPDGHTLLLTCGGGVSIAGPVRSWLCTVPVGGRTVQESSVVTTPDYYERDFALDWSPDGGRIAFSRTAPNGYTALWLARPDGSDLVSVGGGNGDSLNYLGAAWSRGGTNLAFITDTRTTNSNEDVMKLWLADAAGQNRRVVTSTLAYMSILGWAPDGVAIYLRVVENAGSTVSWTSIARVDLASGNITTLVRRSTADFGEAGLSPDGTMLAFVQGRLLTIADTRRRNVRVVARGVSPQARPTASLSPGYGGSSLTTFDWSADSKRLIYVSDGDCPALLGMYSIDVKTRRPDRLTNPCRTAGSAGDDALVGTKATNGMYGLAGIDRIHAVARPDYVDGGRGDDLIDGGLGDDRLYGGPGEDRIDGGRGWDAIVAVDRAKDLIVCGSGYDIVWADRVDDVARDCERVIRR
jgi:Tol biopolymer transport system component